jgi:hypothetical protein
MKKIMFNDRYCLTEAVLEGSKTMTRRDAEKVFLDYEAGRRLGDFPTLTLEEYALRRCPYKVGDIVAVAQRYKDIYPNADFLMVGGVFMTESPGWNNKLFVRAGLMENFIEITDVRFERLQDISDDDCMKEGIYTRAALHSLHVNGYAYTFDNWSDRGIAMGSDTAKGAFAALIDRISGKGTWERNPWVYAYEFELIK